MLAVPPIRAAILSPKAWPYLLLARFAGDKAAPLGSPLVVDVGTLAVQDGDSKLSQSGGRLVLASGAVAAATVAYGASIFARVAGRALLWTVATVPTTNRPEIGWMATVPTSSRSLAHGFDYATTTARIRHNGGTVDTVAAAAPLKVAVILRSTGAFFLHALGGASTYTLLYVANALAASAYAALGGDAGDSLTGQLDDLRVLDLGAPWNSDYGIATARVATTSANSTLTAMSDAVIEHTITAATGVTQELHVRRQDATNKWIVRMAAPGTDTIKLIELVANVETERASSAQTFTNATQYRVVVTCDGATIKTYVADVAKNTYSSATNFQTATGVLVDTAGSDLVAWPRTLALPQGV